MYSSMLVLLLNRTVNKIGMKGEKSGPWKELSIFQDIEKEQDSCRVSGNGVLTWVRELPNMLKWMRNYLRMIQKPRN